MTTGSYTPSLSRAPAGAGPSLDGILSRIDQVSTLPQVALRVMQLTSDPDTTACQLKEAVESDPALGARVLRSVNSSAYALRSQVTNLQQAISFVGFAQVRNLAVTASVSERFRQGDGAGPYKRTGRWRHMVATALCARMIAARLRMPNFDDAFLAGLLHDVGIIIEDEHAHDAFNEMIRGIGTDRALTEVEREALGFDHAELGARVAEAWCFPSSVRAAIEFHHRPECFNGENADLVHVVAVANLICTVKGISSVGVRLVGVPRASMEALELTKQDVKVLAVDLDHEMALDHNLLAT